MSHNNNNFPRWPNQSVGQSPGARSQSPFLPHHVQSPPGRMGSPLPPPFMSATPPPFLIRPMVTSPNPPRPESPRPFSPAVRWSPSQAKSPPPMQFAGPRPFFRPIAPTPPPIMTGPGPMPRNMQGGSPMPPPMAFGHMPLPPPFSPEMFYQMQPSYDMEYVYPPGVEPPSSDAQSTMTEEDMMEGLTTAEIIASQSQDYVDEKLAEYQATIQYLQDEQERVQKKTFTNWINSYLAKHVPPLHVVDLIEDLKDGTKLLGLLQVLSNEYLIKLVNINASDVVDGRPAVVLGLVWTIILYFQIEENTKILTSLGYRFAQATPTRDTDSRPASDLKPSESPITALHTQGGRATPSDRWKQGARRTLLQWVNELIKRDNAKTEITNFGSQWRDGNAFLSMINSIQPNTVNPESLKSSTNRTRLQTAFCIAERELSIPKLLDPEDVDVPKPDEKSIMTYVAQFLHRQSNEPQYDFDSMHQLYDGLITWLNQKIQYNEHMKQTGSMSTNYADFTRMCQELEQKEETYKKLKANEGLVNLDYALLNILWEKLQLQIKEWQWRLDAQLPDPFGRIGQWLAKAEMLVSSHDVPTIMNDEAARVLNSKIEDHKIFFADLPKVQMEFKAALQSAVVASIQADQLKSLANRLDAIPPLAAKRAIKLKFLEHKCCLVAFIMLVENRLKQWSIKYGREDHAVMLLEQYNNFVNKNKIFQEFQRAYIDMEHVIQEYKIEGEIDARESRAADHFLWEIGERWKNISMELRCVQSMLEEVIAYWRRYGNIHPELEEWIDRSLPMVQLPEEQRIEYFQDLSSWTEKYNILQDTVNFLSATCDQPIANELRAIFSRISNKWSILFQQVKQYQFTGQILKLKLEFNKLLSVLQNWIENADEYLTKQPESVEDCRKINEVLQVLIQEIDAKDEQWRLINKKFQLLLPELAGDDVDRTVKTIKREKENLVRVRAQLPVRQNTIQQLLTQQEALLAGQDEIEQWISRADHLLNTYDSVPLKNAATCQQLLDQHKIFFSKKLYYRTMLDSKNKLMETIAKSLKPDQQDRYSMEQARMTKLCNDFADVDIKAQQSEQKLIELTRCWKNYEENTKAVNEWMVKAVKLINEPKLESKQAVLINKEYFERVDERPLKDVIKSSQDLQRVLPSEQYASVAKDVLDTGSHWNDIMARIPLHLTKLEFRLEEEELAALLKDIDKEIIHESSMISRHEENQVILQRHQEYFGSGKLVNDSTRCLDRLEQRRTRFAMQYPDDSSLSEQYEQAQTAYKSVIERLNKLSVQLKDIPAQWTAYRNKFEEVSAWMDSVDQALKSIMTEVSDYESFEAEKSRFLVRENGKSGICRDVDQKRDDMKKLVQMLDLLITKSGIPNEEKYMEEQDLLEGLISRYKNLVPTIEITMVKTEITSRCYTYREETEKICETLKRLKDQTDVVHPETLPEVEQQITQYSDILKSLESQQRPTIISLIQKGKDLQKEPNTLEFVNKQTVLLDETWTSVFDDINDKLKNLKLTQKVWSDYETQKQDILNLLDKAENELRRVLPGTSTVDIAEDLRMKQDLSVELRKATEDTLTKLKDLCAKLEASSTKFKLKDEVGEIEKRLLNLLDLLDKKINSMENEADVVKGINSKLQALQEWMLATQDTLNQLLSIGIPPNDRFTKIKCMQDEVKGKLLVLEEIEAEVRHLGETPSTAVKGEVDELKVGLVNLYESIGVQSDVSAKALTAWTKCQSKIDEIQPWIEKAELKIRIGFNRPSTLTDAKKNSVELKEFSDDVQKIKEKLDDATKEVNAADIASGSSAQDDLDALKNKWIGISNTVMQRRETLDALVQNWIRYEDNIRDICNYIDESEKKLIQNELPQDCADTAMTNYMELLKELSSKCSVYQAKFIPVTQELESITQSISPEGATILASHLGETKSRHAALTDLIRKRMIDASDRAIEKKEREAKVTALTTWLKHVENSVDQLDPVYLNQLPTSLQKTVSLLTEYADHEMELPFLKSEAPDHKPHCDNVKRKIEEKKSALNDWITLQNWVAESESSVQHINRQLLVSGIAEPELLKMKQEVNEILQRLAPIEVVAITLQAKNKALIVKHPTTLEEVNPAVIVEEAKFKLIETLSKLDAKLKDQKLITTKLQEVKNMQDDLSNYMTAVNDKLMKLQPQKIELASIQEYKKTLLDTMQDHELKTPIKVRIGTLCRELMDDEPGNIATMTSLIQSVDSQWDHLSDMLKSKLQFCDGVVTSYAQVADDKDKLSAVLGQIDSEIQQDMSTPVNNSASAATLLTKLKRHEQNLAAHKPKTEELVTECKLLKSKISNIANTDLLPIEDEVSQLETKFEGMKDSLRTKIPKAETQLVLWKTIEGTTQVILQWLDNTQRSLRAAADGSDGPAIRAAIDSYKNHVGEHNNLKLTVEAKAKQLKAITSKEVPALNQALQDVTAKFTAVEGLASQLEGSLRDIQEQEKQIKAALKSNSEKISKVKESMSSCESRTGTAPEILQKLEVLKKAEIEFVGLKPDIETLEKMVKDYKEKNPGWDESHVGNLVKSNKKRMSILGGQLDAVKFSQISLLERNFADKLHHAEKLAHGLGERIKLCSVESASDAYALQAKVATISDVTDGLQEAKRHVPEVGEALKVLESLESYPKMQDCANQYSRLINDIDIASRNLSTMMEQVNALKTSVASYDSQLADLTNEVNQAEASAKHLSSPINLTEMEKRGSEISGLQDTNRALELRLKNMNDNASDIRKLAPDFHFGQALSKLEQRVHSLRKTIDANKLTLDELISNFSHFVSCLNKAENWIEQSVATIQGWENQAIKNAGEVSPEVVKNLVESKEGQDVIHQVLEVGQTILGVVDGMSKDKIRSDIAQLRRKWEDVFDRGNSLIKKLENIKIELSSFEETTAQIDGWIQGISDKIIELSSHQPNLGEKKLALQSLRLLQGDVKSHQDIISNLIGKMKDYDTATKRLQDYGSKYASFGSQLDEAARDKQNVILEHEKLNDLSDAFNDMLGKLRSEVSTLNTKFSTNDCIAFKSAKDALDEKIRAGDKQLENIDAQGQTVIGSTHYDGVGQIKANIDALRSAWISAVRTGQEALKSFTELSAHQQSISSSADSFASWLKSQEAELKDCSFKSTLNAKRDHVSKLQAQLSEFKAKEKDLNLLTADSMKYPIEAELKAKVDDLNARYQMLLPVLQDHINRSESYVADHTKYEKMYENIMAWIVSTQKACHDISDSVRDSNELQDRKTALANLMDQRGLQIPNFDAVISSAEGLYAHTSPDGREIVRQQIKLARDGWDTLNDNLQLASQKIDSCIAQLSNFTAAQAELNRWLRSIETSMLTHTQLKGTLPEKIAQLQNHKLVNQEIISHQVLVESLCEKAQQLIDLTLDKSLLTYVKSIKQLFQNIKDKSNGLLEQLENCIADHKKLLVVMKELKDLEAKNDASLKAIDEDISDKSEISKKLEEVKILKQTLDKQTPVFAKMDEMFELVKQTTSEPGIQSLKAEVEGLKEIYKGQLKTTDDTLDKYNNLLKQWTQFEDGLQCNAKAIRNYENFFRSQELQDNLPKKETILSNLAEERKKVIVFEDEFNKFLESSHTLLRSVNADKIKQLLVQINNRYQLLLVLTKEVVNRWQSLVDDHKLFNEKFAEASSSLTSLKSQFTVVKSEKKDLKEKNYLLKSLNVDKQQLGQKINVLFPLGEKILPDTAATGREAIRQDLRQLRDEFDALNDEISDFIKRDATQSQMLINYNEILQQTFTWLENMEKAANLDQEPSWTSVPDIKTKLNKSKGILQDVISYKRVIENISEKANELAKRNPELNIDDLKKATGDIQTRYEDLTNKLLLSITGMEEGLDYAVQWQDTLKKGNDWAKSIHEELETLKGTNGNKPLLSDALKRTDDLKSSLSEGDGVLESLNFLLQKDMPSTPSNLKEYFQKDYLNLRFDIDRIRDEREEVRHKLQEQLQKWAEFDDRFDKLNSWLEEAEGALKGYGNCNTAEEKDEQRAKFSDFAKVVDSRCKEVQEFLFLAGSVQQALVDNLKNKEPEFVSLSNDMTDVLQSQAGGDGRLPANVHQLMSRFESTQLATKEIVKKANQAYLDHADHNAKVAKFVAQLSSLDARHKELKASKMPQELSSHLAEIRDMIGTQQPVLSSNLNDICESCEKLYPTTGTEGRETLRNEAKQLSLDLENFFDSLNDTENEIRTQLSRWSSFDERKKFLQDWITGVEPLVPTDIVLHVTLDEKRTQLCKYRNCYKDILENQPVILELCDNVIYLPENEDSKHLVAELKKRHEIIMERCKGFVEQYEGFVCNHQQYMKAVEDFNEWLEGVQSAITSWSDESQERTILQAHLERLKNLKASLQEETYRVDDIRSLGNKVIPGTLEAGQPHIRAQIDTSQQDWESLMSSIESSINTLQQKLILWTAFEAEKDTFMAWLKETDSKLHAIDLQPTLSDKVKQLDTLQVIQGEVKSRELEVDSISDRAMSIQKQGLPLKSSAATISEMTQKYQQMASKSKELVTRWQEFVDSHQELDLRIQETEAWLKDISERLACCTDYNVALQKDLEGKLASIHDLLLCKEEGFARIQSLFEKAQEILSNTAPSGHQAINDKIGSLHTTWNNLVSKMLEAKNHLDENIHRWAGFLEQINQLSKSIDQVQATLDANAPFQSTLQEKKGQLDAIRNAEENLSTESYEVDNLRLKAQEMLTSGQQAQTASQAIETLKKFDELMQLIRTLRMERESQFKDHRAYLEAHDELQAWLQRIREKIPMLTQSSGRLFDVENASTVFNNLINKKTQGALLAERLDQAGEVVLVSTSENGQAIIRSEIQELSDAFVTLFNEIQSEKDSLETTVNLLREWKEEYEKLSDWLQQCDIILKTAKITFVSNLEEKRKQVKDINDVLNKLKNGQPDVTKFNRMAEPLIAKSYLDNHVGAMLRTLNSKYEASTKMAGDIAGKVRGNMECHEEFNANLDKATDWIAKAKELLGRASSTSHDSKDRLMKSLQDVQNLVSRQDEGQKLVHITLNLGEKVVRTTKSDGRDTINDQMKELQNEWDRLVKKLSSTKVALETNLLQWADYNSSYTQMQKWITDREAKLAEVTEPKVKPKSILKNKAIPGMSSMSIGDRKANLRATNTIVQDIVSLEPMIESMTSKAENLKQETPASEISTKYQSLNKKAKEIYAKQKAIVEQHQAFVDLANEFMSWVRSSKEKLVKISEPVGDKDTLSNKIAQLKVLQSDVPEGQTKLDLALSKGKDACSIVDDDDKELIEEEVAALQEEFDNFSESLSKTQNQLEVGLVRWKEWEDLYKEAEDWLNKTETEVKMFHTTQNSLDEKRVALETFQVKLQSIFDWQKELDKLNLLAQQLLDTCADSRISNMVTQMTTKFNALLSVTKEVIRRLELQYQEHQQHNALYQECQDWMDRTRDKLTQQSQLSYKLSDVQGRLQSVKAMKQTIEQGQNKLRYVLELKDRIMLTSDKDGAIKIEEDTENLKSDFEKLVHDIQEARQNLTNRFNLLDDIEKLHKQVIDWLNGITELINANGSNEFADLSEKRAYLEKLKAFAQEVDLQSEVLIKLDNKIKEVEGMPKEDYLETFATCETVKEKLAHNVINMEQIVATHDNYKKLYNETCECLRKLRIDIQNFADCVGDKTIINEKIKKLQEFAPMLKNGMDHVKEVRAIGNKASETCSSEGKDVINRELNQLTCDMEAVQSLQSDAIAKLKKGEVSWDEFTKILNLCKSTIETLSEKVNSEPDLEHATPEDLERIRDLLGEITSQKYSMEDLNEKCEQLIEECGAPQVRDDTVNVQTAYSTLLANAQALLSKTQKKLADHTEFLKAKQEISDWLTRAEGTVEDCSMNAKESTMRENLETLKNLIAKQTEGQHLVNLLQNAFTRLINAAPIEQQDSMRSDVDNIRTRWENFCLNIKNNMSRLKETLQRWNEFHTKCKSFEGWIEKASETLNGVKTSGSDLSAIKTTNEIFKSLQNEIQAEKLQLEKLFDEAQLLASSSGENSSVDTVSALHQKWSKLNERVNGLRSALENEIKLCTEYYDQLQDIEKWLLQVSFQLMAHNSLYITNREQTVEQLKVHEQLLDTIKGYNSVLDDIKQKGQAQIFKYGDEVKPSIEKQLENVSESYTSLLNTGIQIKNRLLESLAKFKDYESTLESIIAMLNEIESQVREPLQMPLLNLPDVDTKMQDTRKLHNRLQGEKNRLSLAIHACEAATASLSRPASPQEVFLQPVPDKELAIRSRLEFSIDQVQTKLASLQDSLASLEDVAIKKDDLSKWADDTMTALQDFRSPSKLKQESGQAELNHLQDIRNTSAEKLLQLEEIEIMESSIVQELYLPSLRSKLENIDSEVQVVIEGRLNLQDKVNNHQELLNTTISWLDSIASQLERLEKPSDFDLDKKLDAVAKLQSDFTKSEPEKMASVKESGENLKKGASPIDYQIIEDRLSNVDKKSNDLRKRIERKRQILEQVKKNLTEFYNDLQNVNDFIRNKTKDHTSHIGYEIQPIESAINEIKTNLRELDGKEMILVTLEKRLASLQNEMEESEIEDAKRSLASAATDLEKFRENLRGQSANLKEGIKLRRKFHDTVENVNAWVNRIAKELILSSTNPLSSFNIQPSIANMEKLVQQIKDRLDSTEIHGDYEKLRKECDDQERNKLDALVNAIEQSLKDLLSTAELQKDGLISIFLQRKAFEDDCTQCENALSECETTLGLDIKGSANLPVLEQQLAKLRNLLENSKSIKEKIDELRSEGQKMMHSLNEPDRQVLADQLSALVARGMSVDQNAAEKIAQVEHAIQGLTEATTVIADCRAYLKKIKAQLEELDKPLGNNTDETQSTLKLVEALMVELKDHRLKLDSEKFQALRSNPDFRDVLKEEDNLLQDFEKLAGNLRHLILLQQQYLTLVTEIQNFLGKHNDAVGDIQRSGGNKETHIQLYDDLLKRVQHNEGQLAAAMDKGERIAEEGSIADRNTITEQLQCLKQGLSDLRRALEAKRSEDAEAMAEFAKYSQELDDIMSWLHENELKIKSRPVLEKSQKSIDNELERHEALAKEVITKLNDIETIEKSLSSDKIPAVLADKLSEARSLRKTLPQELSDRLDYMKKQKSLRQQYEKLVTNLKNWIEEADKKLSKTENGLDLERVGADLTDYKAYLSNEKEIIHQLGTAKQVLDIICQSVSPSEQEVISKEHQQLNESVQNTFNNLKSRIAHLEQGGNVLKLYEELLASLQALLNKSEEPVEPGSNLGALKFNLSSTGDAIKLLQDNQGDLQSLQERAANVCKVANQNSKTKVQNQVQSLTDHWTLAGKNLEVRKEDLSHLISQWEQCEISWQKFESGLAAIEDSFSQIDPTIRSQQQLNETRETLESILNSCNDLEPTHKDLLKNASYILNHLKTASEISYTSLNGKLSHLTEQYQAIINLVMEKLKWLNSQDNYLSQIDDKIIEFQKTLSGLETEVTGINTHEANEETVQAQLKELGERIEGVKLSIYKFNTDLKDKFTSSKQIIPTNVAENVSGLELQAERLSSVVADKLKEMKRRHGVLSDYTQNVQQVRAWCQKAEKSLMENENAEPAQLKQQLQAIMGELPKIQDQTEAIERLGKILVDSTSNNEDKQKIKDEVTAVSTQVDEIRKLIEERHYKIGESLDSWQKFLQLHAQVMVWCAEKKQFLEEPVALASLAECRMKLNNYMMAVKSLKNVGKQLSEMGRELDRIAETSNVGPLHAKLDEAEQLKIAVETELLERNALLQETTEEWEQCEKKFHETRIWLEKTGQLLQSQSGKRKPLRDQLAAKEKLLADVAVQKTKIGLSMEKLQVHFKSGIGGDPKVAEEEAQLQNELDTMHEDIKNQCLSLESAVAQIDKLQEEIQVLRSQLGVAEQKLRHVCSPSYLSGDRERAAMEQTAWREKLKGIQSKITARNERIKLLMLLGTPSSEPLH